jgi:methylmalonyl-CoA mutase
LDEAIALPTDFSARIARNTQLHLQKETDITFTADPWGGSYYVEKLTADLIARAESLMSEVDELGGMTKAIEAGIPKMRIEEAAAKKQARIDSATDIIVGVNAFKTADRANIDILEVKGDEVREQQLEGLNALKSERDEKAVSAALVAIEAAAQGDGNLLALAVEAAKVRATLGEISLALENKWGRYKATTKTISGVYSKEMVQNEDFEKAREASDAFAKKEGRRPRIMVAKMGQDGHDRGAKVVATSFADLGFDVDMGPLFQTPKEAAKQAVENDVHILGVSSLAAGHKTLVPAVMEALKELGREDIMVIVGGVIPAQDYEFLYDQGVAGIFGPGTPIAKAAAAILHLMMEE